MGSSQYDGYFRSLELRNEPKFVQQYFLVIFVSLVSPPMATQIRVRDLAFEESLSAKQIADRVAALAETLAGALVGTTAGTLPQNPPATPPLFVAVLRGAAIFHADLIRAYPGDLEVGYVRTRSYVGTESSGEVSVEFPDDLETAGRHVVVVEDIADSGRTLRVLAKAFSERRAASVTTVVLLDKPAARVVPFEPDHVGFTIAPAFVVGYGLDYDGLGRNLPAIYALVDGG